MSTAMTYDQFLATKHDFGSPSGFTPIEIPDCLHGFQGFLSDWIIRMGRGAVYADCGMGKTLIIFVFADNCVRHTNRPTLILCPLAVGGQMVREAEKFGFSEVEQSRDGRFSRKIVVTNYEKLHLFNPGDFSCCVCDEAGILKDYDGKTRAAITEFMRTIPYRMLSTATPAPNDYPELGTHSECLGNLGYQDMLTRFFKQQDAKDKKSRLGWGRLKYRLRGYAERDFFRWICSWARACRKPSDLGFDDGPFVLPGLDVSEHVVEARTKRPGFLLDMPAITLGEQQEERRRTIRERCERAAELVDHDRPAIVWTHLNPEGDLAADLIKGSVQVSGSDSDEAKEEAFLDFVNGKVRVLVSKPSIAAWGLNFQHCAHQTTFSSNSFESYYQAIRRSYRFGQTQVVKVDIVLTEGEVGVMANLQRKSEQAEILFTRLVDLMNDQLHLRRDNPFTQQEEFPSWLASIR